MQVVAQFFRTVLGLNVEELAFYHMLARAVVVYVTSVALVRMGEKRFLGKNTAFDVILAIILGSVVSRAITGNAPFFPTLTTAAGLVLLHWLLAFLTFHIDGLGSWVKGEPHVLVQGGEIQWQAMRKSHISENDLMTAVRGQGSTTLTDVQEAWLERNGSISIIKADS